MDLFWIIYFIDTILSGNFVPHFLWGLLGSLIIGGFGSAAYCDFGGGSFELVIKFWKKIKWQYIVFMSIWMMITMTGKLLPTKDTAYKMLAAYGVTEAYTAAMDSDKVQAVAGKSLKVLEKAMDDYLTKEDK